MPLFFYDDGDYCSQYGEKANHHAKEEPEDARGLGLGRFLVDDYLRVSQGVGIMDWFLLGIVGD